MNSDIREPLNVGSSEMVSINSMVEIIESIAGVKITPKYNLEAPKGVRGRNSDNTRIQNLLNWQPSISLSTGLSATYKWIEEQVNSHNGN
jgi:nucleoside-diphosphate-sugar epimerase